jgi:hypothetical protein
VTPLRERAAYHSARASRRRRRRAASQLTVRCRASRTFRRAARDWRASFDLSVACHLGPAAQLHRQAYRGAR